MLAEEFGYQVSPRAAAEHTPGTLEDLRAVWARQSRIRNSWVISVVAIGTAVITLTLPHPIMYMFPAAALVGCLAGVRAVRRAERDMARSMRSRPWQVWPVRMEAQPQTAKYRRISLLAPDKTTAATFNAAVPRDVWFGMTDGRGLVWFVGDLRFGGVMALPGGRPGWVVTPLPEPPPEQRPAGGGGAGALEDSLIAEAGRSVIWELLG